MERDAPEPAVLRSLRARLEMDAGLGAEYFADPGGELLRAVEALTKAAPAAPAGRKETAAPRREFVAAPVPASAPAVSAVSAAGLPAGHVSLVPLEAAPGNPSKEALLADLRRESGTCALCGLCERRSSVVWGEGSLDADILFIGEGPGRDEDIEGRPFVGRSGRLLTDIIEKGMRRPRSSVYIANVVKCRPPGNRDPRPEEVAACSRYLNKQIEVVRPAVIVAVGMVAGRALLGLPPGTGGLRGVWHSHEGIPLRVIYHPSYLLRQRDAEGGGRTKADKATWDDMLAVMEKAAR